VALLLLLRCCCGIPAADADAIGDVAAPRLRPYLEASMPGLIAKRLQAAQHTHTYLNWNELQCAGMAEFAKTSLQTFLCQMLCVPYATHS
jgi:hypothetical protein